MKKITKRCALVASAVAASSLFMFSSGAQADTSAQSAPFPCGVYQNSGDGLQYYGNCASNPVLIEISSPTQQICVPAETSILLGLGWNVRVVDPSGC